MTDRIEILGVRGWGHHGVFPDERRDGQEFVVDIVVGLTLSGLQDDLSRTVDYSQIAKRAHQVIIGEAYDLIETVAERIIEECAAMAAFEFVEVAVHKPSALMEVPFDDVVVRIRREFR